MSENRQPVFIGGTGRSGTHAVARLLGRHSHLADVPIEARFHCNKRGLPDLLEGRITLNGYLSKLRGFWWHRVRVDGHPRGLYNLHRRYEFDAACERFQAAYPENPIDASRRLVLDLLEPVAARAGKPRLVEMSSHNVKEAQTLLRLFPDARVIHALRDGRDAATSVSDKTWGPNSVTRGIDWWEARLREIERGVRGEEDGASYSIPSDRFRVVLLDDLVGPDRERAYAELLEFLELPDEEPIRTFFESSVTADAAHAGRWRRELGPVARRRVASRYQRAVTTLEQEGNHAAPVLRAALSREGPS